jgi:NhaP-type Na+/H+ or K+/H+ antiporter
MHVEGVIALVGALIFLAHFFTGLFSRTRIPDVLLLILIGLLIGPVLHLTTRTSFGRVGPVFTTITLVLLLFEGGLDLGIDTLRKSLRGTLVLTLLSFAFTVLVASFATWRLAHLSFLQSLTLGAIVGGTSPAVVIPLAAQLKMGPQASATLFLESALGDVLSIIITLALVDSEQIGRLRLGTLMGGLLASLLFATLIGVASAFVWSMLLHRVRNFEHTAFTTAAFLFLIYGLVEYLGFSGPVSALAFGATLGNIGFFRSVTFRVAAPVESVGLNFEERAFLSEVVFLLKTFFFVYIGLSVELTQRRLMASGLAITALIYLVRLLAVRLGASRAIPRADASRMAALAPKGLAAAVLASVGVEQGLPNAFLAQNLVYSIILLTIILATVLVFLQDRTPIGRMYGRLMACFPAGLAPADKPIEVQVPAG